ncbi:energy-coupling factor transporter ATPase [Zhaonella formicivorans]|jgi:energy-coupling factor transport system ATP-binding protein|uniref:energy-coupling factor transporter ATPase n=1 Tax=Zhaonella formicivorans TaxID=2528593 RepID=UPI0010EFDB00|nr:energy-coupling factor transporter ATPase [Zhaonella formicivorans]
MLIKIESLSHVYKPNTPYETRALDDISLEITSGQFVGLIGHTGSGKSTLIQHLNGLLLPTSGRVLIGNDEITPKTTRLKNIRHKVGIVFQYPEHQLFEETVYADIAFGPKNLGWSEEKIAERVKAAMAAVNLDFDSLKDRSPFALSGGQMRRVAIAGVLAMEPQVLILDEPTAGLDPGGRDEILTEIASLHQQLKITIILVSHSMEDIARYAQRVIVMHQGKVVMDGTPREIFLKARDLEKLGLGVPMVTTLMHRLAAKGLNVRTDVLTVEEAKEEILNWWRGNKNA